MKKTTLLSIILLFSSMISFAQLSAGDIAFIGYNTDQTNGSLDHNFSFIALTDIPAGEVIFFTEEGWNSGTSSWAGNTEGHYSWTAPAGGTACGTVIHIFEAGADFLSGSSGTVSSLLSGSNWNLSAGDQVLAYQAASAEPVSPTFIAAVHGDFNSSCFNATTSWNDPTCQGTSTTSSSLPEGLTNGVDCVALFISGSEQDNAKYTGTLTGDSNTLRALINDRTNWSTDNGTAFPITPSDYSPSVTCVAACDASFSFSASSYCADDTDPTPTITGDTGGTFSATPAGLSLNSSSGIIDVSASTPNTYTVTYTAPGTCSSDVSVTINALDDASFSYAASAYCVDDSDPTPTITGLTGGSFSSTAGLSIASNGTIDVSASTPGTYTVTYTTAGTCPNSSTASVTINALDDASFSYSSASYLVTDADPTPTITGLTGGSFSSTAGLSIASNGTIDLSASTPNTYTVTYTTAGTCPNSSIVSVTIVDPAPTVTITSTESPGPTGASPIPVTITFSESVSDFVIGDLTVGNGMADNFSGSGATYTADIIPTAAGAVTVDIAADVATDSGSNGNIAATQFSIEFDNVLGINDEALANELTIYPIPSNNLINISGDTSLSLQHVDIFDIQGKLVLSQKLASNRKTNAIDISSIDSGFYLMTVESEKGIATKRIIKQ